MTNFMHYDEQREADLDKQKVQQVPGECKGIS